MNSILVGFDDSDSARSALEFAAGISRLLGADLVVAVVDEVTPEQSSPLEDRREAMERIESAARERLGGVPFEFWKTTGPVAGALAQLARDGNADLIVVGTTHHGSVGRVIIGSVCERLLRASARPVVVVPPGAPEPDPAVRGIGVAIDDEVESQAALTFATEMAAEMQAPLRLITVHPPRIELMRGRISGTLPGYQRTIRRRLSESLNRAEATLPTEIESTTVLVSGEVGEELAAQSRSLSLLAMGSRGYGPGRRAVLGGTASDVIRKSSCPVLVVPRSAVGDRH